MYFRVILMNVQSFRCLALTNVKGQLLSAEMRWGKRNTWNEFRGSSKFPCFCLWRNQFLHVRWKLDLTSNSTIVRPFSHQIKSLQDWTTFRELSFVSFRNLQGLCNVPGLRKVMTTRATMINGILTMVVVAMTVNTIMTFFKKIMASLA